MNATTTKISMTMVGEIFFFVISHQQRITVPAESSFG